MADHQENHARQRAQIREMLRQRMGRDPSERELDDFMVAARAQVEQMRAHGGVRVPSREEAAALLRARGVEEPTDEQVSAVVAQAEETRERMSQGAGVGGARGGSHMVTAGLQMPTEEQVKLMLQQRGVEDPTGEQIQKVMDDTRAMQQRQLQARMMAAQQAARMRAGAGLGEEEKGEPVLPSEDEVREMYRARGLEATDEQVREFLAGVREASGSDTGLPTRDQLRAMLTADGREPTEQQIGEAEARIARAIALRREGRVDPNKALIGCIKRGDVASARKCVDELGADVNAATEQGNSAVMWAAWHTVEDAVRFLIDRGADVRQRNARRQTPMHWAAMGGSVHAVRFLFEAGAPIGDVDEDGFTPMHAAAQFGRTLAMSYLRVHGADVEARDVNGRTPLHWSCYKSHVIASKWLIRNQRADITVQDKDGRLPLHWAAGKNNVACVKALVSEGADEQLDVRDANDQTAEEFAAAREPPSDRAVAFLAEVRSMNTGYARRLRRLFCQTGHKQQMEKTAQKVTAWVWIMLVATFVHGSAYMYPRNDDSSGMRAAFEVWWACGAVAAVSWLVTKFREPGYVPLPAHRAAPRPGARAHPGAGAARPGEVVLDVEMDEVEAGGGGGDGGDGDGVELRAADSLAQGSAEEENAARAITYEEALMSGQADRLCPTCEIIRPPRSKHDPVSDRCVQRFDHFCPWVGNAVGERTHPPFLVFVWFIFVCLLMHVVLVCVHFSRNGFEVADVSLLPFLLHSFFMTLYAMTLALQHTWFAWRNVTTNEEVNGYRYAYLRDRDGKFVNPFDEGPLRNCLVFWGCREARPFEELSLRTEPLTQEELAMVRPGAQHKAPRKRNGLQRVVVGPHATPAPGGGGHGHSHGGGGHGHSHGGGGHGHSHGGGH